MEKRAVLAIALSLIVLFGSQWVFQRLGWVAPPRRAQPIVAQSDTSSLRAQAQGQTGGASAPGAVTLSPGAPPPPPPSLAAPAKQATPGGWMFRSAQDAPDRILEIDEPLYTVRLRTRGARLLSVVLKKYKDGDSGRATLAADPALALDLGGLASPLSLADVPYTAAESLDATGRVAGVTLTALDSTGLRITQSFRLPAQDYDLDYAVSLSGAPPTWDVREYRLSLTSWPLLTERTHQEDLGNLGVTAKLGKDNKRSLAAGLRKEPHTYEGSIPWLAVHSKYFLLGLIARNVTAVASRAALAPGTLPEQHDQVTGSLVLPLPASGRVHEFTLWAGPLDYWHIQKYGMDLEPPRALFFNFFRPFSSALAWIMTFFHSLIHNWGVAIVLLSTLAKIAFHPLQASGMRSMRAMQKIQPEVERLRKKHDKDPQKLNTAVMGLYKEHKVNPMSGCLPMVIQMPVFLALYHVLSYSIALRQASFVGWIHDLSSPDLLFMAGPFPVRVLPILMAGSMMLQQRFTPTDPKQLPTMYMMNLVMLFIFYNLPSGLVLYWTVINLLTALQQYMLTHGENHAAAKVAA